MFASSESAAQAEADSWSPGLLNSSPSTLVEARKRTILDAAPKTCGIFAASRSTSSRRTTPCSRARARKPSSARSLALESAAKSGASRSVKRYSS
jgi:hypothetical protein